MTNLLNNFLLKPAEIFISRLRATLEHQRTIKELEKLTDRELNDIGIGRGDIYNVAKYNNSDRINDNLKGWV
jgi:uncharacterized protein YjiS (DUF1127 family)